MKLFDRIIKAVAIRRIKRELISSSELLNQKPQLMKNELLTRLANESPSFFKKIQAIGITLGAVGLAIISIPASVVVLPAIVVTVGGYFVAVGTVAAAVAKTTVADSDVLKK